MNNAHNHSMLSLKLHLLLRPGVNSFPKTWEPPPNSLSQITNMKQLYKIYNDVSNTTNLYYVFNVLGQHVSILIESASGPSKKIDPYLEMFKMRCGIPNAYILDKTMYKMHVLSFS